MPLVWTHPVAFIVHGESHGFGEYEMVYIHFSWNFIGPRYDDASLQKTISYLLSMHFARYNFSIWFRRDTRLFTISDEPMSMCIFGILLHHNERTIGCVIPKYIRMQVPTQYAARDTFVDSGDQGVQIIRLCFFYVLCVCCSTFNYPSVAPRSGNPRPYSSKIRRNLSDAFYVTLSQIVITLFGIPLKCDRRTANLYSGHSLISLFQ